MSSGTLEYAEQFVDGGLELDRGISYAVKVLREAGIETFESCEGGSGHPFPEPTVRFHGQAGEGFRALAVALEFGLPVFSLRRYWSIEDQVPVGPQWELVFFPASRLRKVQRDAEKSGLIR